MNRHNLPYLSGMSSIDILTRSRFRKLALLQIVKSYTIVEPVHVNMQRAQSVCRLVYHRGRLIQYLIIVYSVG
jgi:hypothetical protein